MNLCFCPQSVHRIWLISLILLALLSVGQVGCATGKKRLQRKSIEQLYLEAVRARATQISEVRSSKASNEVVWEDVAEEEVSLQHPPKSILEKQSDTPTLPELRRYEEAPIESESESQDESAHDSTEASSVQTNDGRHLNKIFDETWPAKAVSYQEELAAKEVVTGEVVTGPVVADKPTSEITYTYDKDWQGTDLVEAIQELALSGGVTVMIDENVGGEVKGTTKTNNFEEALESILLPHSMYYAKEGDKYYIAPADLKSPMFRLISSHEEFVPLYQDVQILLESLPDRLQVFAKKIASPDRILIDAPKPIIEEIKSRLQELDVLVPQVKLEAIVCFIAPEQGFQFGLDWNHAVKIDGQSSFNFGISGLSFSGLASQKGFQNTFSDYAVTSGFLKLLAKEGYLTLRAAPSVVASTGKQAAISISRETYFSLQPANAVNIFRQDVQTVNAGIVLNITPTIRGDTISVNLEKAEVSEDVRTNDSRPELNSNPYPIINRRTVSTTVNVKDGETLVIGGLVQRQTVDRINRVVGLSDIPLLGNLFRTVEKQEQDVEVAIFISPSLVRE